MHSTSSISREAKVRAIFRKLIRTWGPQHWWPADTPFEVIAGAILTQNTSWLNIERALSKLREANALTVTGIRDLPLSDLEQLIRSSGYYRQKAERLRGFVHFLDEHYDGSLEKMFATPTAELRTCLLALKGVGPETADAILLYAGGHEVFVVDNYAKRILSRHGMIETRATYDEVRNLVEHALRRERPTQPGAAGKLPPEMRIHQPSRMSRSKRSPLSQIYNEMHGLLVQIGKHHCDKLKPNCDTCPLRQLLPPGGPIL